MTQSNRPRPINVLQKHCSDEPMRQSHGSNEFFHLPPPAPLRRDYRPLGGRAERQADRGAMRDTVPVPPVGAVTITSDDNNRGRWLEFRRPT